MVKKKEKTDKQSILNAIPLQPEIENICKVLESTDLHFTQNYLKRYDRCEYCLEGVLAKNAKIDISELDDETSLEGIGFNEINRQEILNKFKKFYGFDPLVSYYGKDGHKVICPIPKCESFENDGEPVTLESPEHVFTHINDEHNKEHTHKENARLIRLFSQYYNIISGERIK